MTLTVKVTSNSPSQDYTHPDDHNLPTYDMTPGFKPFTVLSMLKGKYHANSMSFQNPKNVCLLTETKK